MKLIIIMAALLIALVGCGSDEPDYAEMQKEALDQVSKDVEKAADEAKEKIDDALKNLE